MESEQASAQVLPFYNFGQPNEPVFLEEGPVSIAVR